MIQQWYDTHITCCRLSRRFCDNPLSTFRMGIFYCCDNHVRTYPFRGNNHSELVRCRHHLMQQLLWSVARSWLFVGTGGGLCCSWVGNWFNSICAPSSSRIFTNGKASCFLTDCCFLLLLLLFRIFLGFQQFVCLSDAFEIRSYGLGQCKRNNPVIEYLTCRDTFPAMSERGIAVLDRKIEKTFGQLAIRVRHYLQNTYW